MCTTRIELKNKKMMELALSLSELSTCSRRAVGCIITNDKYVIVGSGFNGREPGREHCADSNKEKRKEHCNCKHAEANAIQHIKELIFPGIEDLDEVAIPHMLQAYVTTVPCIDCMNLLIKNNVFRIFYKTKYTYYEVSKKIADANGIEIISMEDE